MFRTLLILFWVVTFFAHLRVENVNAFGFNFNVSVTRWNVYAITVADPPSFHGRLNRTGDEIYFCKVQPTVYRLLEQPERECK